MSKKSNRPIPKKPGRLKKIYLCKKDDSYFVRGSNESKVEAYIRKFGGTREVAKEMVKDYLGVITIHKKAQKKLGFISTYENEREYRQGMPGGSNTFLGFGFDFKKKADYQKTHLETTQA